MSAASVSSQLARLLSRSARLATPATARLSARASARHISTSRVVARSAAGLRARNTAAPVNGLARQYSSKSYPDHQLVGMPALSPTMTQGNVGQWQKSVGDRIEPGDVLVEIETDKAQMDFEFQEEGYLARILAPTGTKDLKIDSPVAIIVENEADVAAFADFSLDQAGSTAPPAAATASSPAKAESVKEEASPATPAQALPTAAEGDRIFSSPLAKTLAKEKGIDLALVRGSGPRGRIVKSDIEGFVASGVSKAAAASTAAVTPAKASEAAAAASAPAPAAKKPAASAGFTDIPLTNMRKVIATRLTEAKSTIPHYYLTQNITMDNVNKLRHSLNTAANGAYKLSVNDFVIKAAASALRDVPDVNSSWQGEFIRQHHHADIAVAAATPAGLITPIVKTCDAKGLRAISSDVRDLVARARANKLKPEEFQGGSFTISNLGMYGITSFSAIINPPHSAILSVGSTEPQLVIDPTAEKGFKSVDVMSVQLSADHRVVDGATGAQFLKALKGYLENPLTLLL
ncbi:pyruvate dehydrogenase complex dihydrolipoamide acetyltransferase component (E2) [Coemansia aciculifera]|uniref:Acetyltransferase component of pyruvate dehydrogenase complex n=1 Tax=Coemansia aciculifera TaxID=417176 RepID=A0A9W8IKD3_9FUNG|nr:pyruvate dehydrogenase complex dihydrolipoamide acetyltransferase component (E2) [Coemansia aciculifera]KAJ2875523.1 pyruvate dehydrogenase complex dihydrolipoamide acetyltransferase component (E2) [Coemansia aciculifera]